MRNPIEVYTHARRIIFAQMQKNPTIANEWLEKTYRKKLGPRGYAGLKAEMAFFEQHKKDFQLVLAADIGDATDFVGSIDGEMHRIDVTTNLNFKRLSSYEPLQLEGARYKIAVLDDGKFDLIDINFRFCPKCGNGRILPTGILLKENRDKDGSSRWSNDQLLVDICNGCGEVEVGTRITTPFLYDFDHIYKELNEAKHNSMETCEQPIDVEKEATAYARQASRFLSDAFGTRLVAVGSKHYKVTNPSNADGYWIYQFVDRLTLVDGHLEVEYPCDLVDE